MGTRARSGLIYGGLMLGAAWVGAGFFGALLLVIYVQGAREMLALTRRWGPLGSALGLIGLALSLGSLLALRLEGGALVVVKILVSAFVFDTASYVGGRTIGGPKLVPRLSPNKTVAGLVCGLFSLGVLAFLGHVFQQDQALQSWGQGWHHGSQVAYALLGHGVLVHGLLHGSFLLSGDLLISALKRANGVKDASNLIPGHGGILDRIDSLLLISVLIFIGQVHI